MRGPVPVEASAPGVHQHGTKALEAMRGGLTALRERGEAVVYD